MTAWFLVELHDHFNEAVAALPAQHVAEIGRHLVRRFVVAALRMPVFSVDSRPKVTAEKVWSQREGCQQGQHQESFCSINQCHRRQSPSEVWPVQDKQLAQPLVQGSCQMQDLELDL